MSCSFTEPTLLHLTQAHFLMCAQWLYNINAYFDRGFVSPLGGGGKPGTKPPQVLQYLVSKQARMNEVKTQC